LPLLDSDLCPPHSVHQLLDPISSNFTRSRTIYTRRMS
jgi:hypothetical protein